MAEAPENIDQCELSWKLPFWHQDLAIPNSLQALVLERLRRTTSKIGTQPRSSADRLPKAILSQQPPLNTNLNMAMPSREQDPAPPTRGQTPVPPTRKPAQVSGTTSPTRRQTPERGAIIMQPTERRLKHRKLDNMTWQRNMSQTKEQDKNSQGKLNEVEIGNLPEKEFKVMIVKMIQDLGKKWWHGSRRYKRCLTKT